MISSEPSTEAYASKAAPLSANVRIKKMRDEKTSVRACLWTLGCAIIVSFFAPGMMCGHMHHDVMPMLVMIIAGAVGFAASLRLAISARGGWRVCGVLATLGAAAWLVLIALAIMEEM